MLCLALSCLRVSAGQGGLGLVDLRLKSTRIDREEAIALLDVIALLEVDLRQLAAHLRFDGDNRIRLNVADDLKFDGNVSARDCGNSDGDSVSALFCGRRR